MVASDTASPIQAPAWPRLTRTNACKYRADMEIALDFVWDEDKRRTNLAKHKIDFVDMQALFDGRPDYTWMAHDLGKRAMPQPGGLTAGSTPSFGQDAVRSSV